MTPAFGAPRGRRPSGWLRLFALTLVVALVAVACGGRDDDDDSAGNGNGNGNGASVIDTSTCPDDPSVEVSGDTIKFGTSLPQSGIYASFAAILAGEKAYFDYLNEEKGGVKIGDKTYKVELVDTDDQYLAEKTLSNVNELIDTEDVFGLFNVVGTKNNLAIRQRVQESCVPNLFAATGSPVWGNPDYPWLIGTLLVPYTLEAKAFADYLKENEPDATVAVLSANDDFGKAYVQTFKDQIEGTEIRIVDEETYDPETPDPKNQVTSLARSNADTFLLAATLTACPSALNAAGAANWKPLIYMSGTCTSKTLMDLAGANGDGVLSVAPLLDPANPANDSNEAMKLYKEQVAKYAPEGTDVKNAIVAYGWSVAALLEATLAQAESATRLAVMEAARNIDGFTDIALQLPGATWDTSEDDAFIGEMFNLVQYDGDGKFFAPVGDLIDESGKTADVTPADLINS